MSLKLLECCTGNNWTSDSKDLKFRLRRASEVAERAGEHRGRQLAKRRLRSVRFARYSAQELAAASEMPFV